MLQSQCIPQIEIARQRLAYLPSHPPEFLVRLNLNRCGKLEIELIKMREDLPWTLQYIVLVLVNVVT